MHLIKPLILATAFALGICALSSTSPAAAKGPAAIVTGPCAPGLPAGARCGTIDVPEDRSRPKARRLRLAFIVVPGEVPAEAAPTFLLVGGPGQGAAQVAPAVLAELRSIDPRGDLVFIDQRGTGASNPLVCAAGFDLLGSGRAGDVRACAASLAAKASLGQYGTPDAVRDLESARAAFGYDRINLFGVSYGSRLAWAYMRAHPRRVRVAILRAAAGPGFNIIRDGLANGEAELMRTLADCEADAFCAVQFPRRRAQLAEIRQRLARAPARVNGPAGELVVTPELFEQTLYALMLTPAGRQQIPLQIATVAERGFEPLAPILQAVRAQLYGALPIGMYLSVVCAEDAPAIGARELEGGAGLAALGPRLKETCRDWPVKPVDRAFFRPVRAPVPTLIVSGGLDPSTNAAAGEALHAMLPRSRHIVAPTAAHAPLLPDCAKPLAVRLIETGRLPQNEVDCSGPPLPPFTRRQVF